MLGTNLLLRKFVNYKISSEINNKTKQKFRFVSDPFKNVQMNLVEKKLVLNLERNLEMITIQINTLYLKH